MRARTDRPKWKKPMVCAALAAMLAVFPGCWGARELKELSLVLGIGIDKNADNPDTVYMTVQIVKPGELKQNRSSGGSGSDGKAYWNLMCQGQTVFDAVRQATEKTSNKLYVAHNEAIVFGRSAAEGGLRKYLDFFLRAQETRPNTDILVSATTASDALDVMPELEKLPGFNISKLTESQGFTSHSMPVTLRQLATAMMSPTTSAVVPLVVIREDKGEQVLVIDGMAVFKKDKMIGTLTSPEARGLLWVLNKVQSGVMDIACQDGIASIEIKSARCSTEVELAGDRAIAHVKVREEGVMVAQTSTVNLGTVYYMAVLEQMQAVAIKLEIANAVAKASELNADIFGFGDMLHKKYKDQWQRISINWDRIFPAMQVELDVECKLTAAGNINGPIIPK